MIQFEPSNNRERIASVKEQEKFVLGIIERELGLTKQEFMNNNKHYVSKYKMSILETDKRFGFTMNGKTFWLAMLGV